MSSASYVIARPIALLAGQVEALLDRRTRYRRTEYLVHWKGWTAEHDTWEPRKHIEEQVS